MQSRSRILLRRLASHLYVLPPVVSAVVIPTTLAATIEAFERQRLEAEPMEKRRRDEELEAAAMEMHKRWRVEDLELAENE